MKFLRALSASLPEQGYQSIIPVEAEVSGLTVSTESAQDVETYQFTYLSTIIAAHNDVKGVGVSSFHPGRKISEQNQLSGMHYDREVQL